MGTATKTLMSSAAVIALLAGCASGSDTATDTDTDPPADPVTTVETSTDDSVAAQESVAEPAEPEPVESTPPATEAPAPTGPPLVAGVDGIELLTPPAEAGTQPELAWASIDGAADHRVVVLDADGAPYWSWSGPETSVFLGGGESSEGAGPSVGAGFTWSVIAFDANGEFLAASAVGTLAS